MGAAHLRHRQLPSSSDRRPTVSGGYAVLKAAPTAGRAFRH